MTKIVKGTCSDCEQKLHSVLWAYYCAYKTLVGIAPFNLVFRLDAILPIEFLVPKLRIAQKLEWMGHAQRIEELEKLYKTRLQAIAGMYEEKRRQKQWHDKNLCTQEFHKGTLVLFYTLKKQKHKLKIWGL